jgi:hypothetical protein
MTKSISTYNLGNRMGLSMRLCAAYYPSLPNPRTFTGKLVHIQRQGASYSQREKDSLPKPNN